MDQERNAHACLLSCTHSRRTACPCLLATSNRKQHLKDTRWPSHFGHRSNKERPLLLAAASSGQWDWIHRDRCARGGGVGPRSSEGCCRSSSFCITNRPSGVSLHARPAIEPKWLYSCRHHPSLSLYQSTEEVCRITHVPISSSDQIRSHHPIICRHYWLSLSASARLLSF